LSKRDLALLHLAGDGAQFPRFADTTPLSSEQAFIMASQTYEYHGYEATPAALVELVRSGKLTDVGLALPRTIAEAQAAAEMDGRLKIVAGNLHAVDTSVNIPKIESIAQFWEAFAGTIAPALADRPLALFDWINLGRSLIVVEKHQGWKAASSYLTRILNKQVNLRLPFGAFDTNLWVQLSSSVAAPPRQPREPKPARAATPGKAAAAAPLESQICRQWNSPAGCKFQSQPGGCRRVHKCLNFGMAGCDGNHQRIHCSIPPPSARTYASSVASFQPAPVAAASLTSKSS
jgi:hypothetical protein